MIVRIAAEASWMVMRWKRLKFFWSWQLRIFGPMFDSSPHSTYNNCVEHQAIAICSFLSLLTEQLGNTRFRRAIARCSPLWERAT